MCNPLYAVSNLKQKLSFGVILSVKGGDETYSIQIANERPGGNNSAIFNNNKTKTNPNN